MYDILTWYKNDISLESQDLIEAETSNQLFSWKFTKIGLISNNNGICNIRTKYVLQKDRDIEKKDLKIRTQGQ